MLTGVELVARVGEMDYGVGYQILLRRQAQLEVRMLGEPEVLVNHAPVRFGSQRAELTVSRSTEVKLLVAGG